jgi:lipopolysaccharide/colanic/teichoic acid biosynthesis glycosyltransferase
VEEKERYEKAKKRVEDIKGFYVHLMVYIAVNLGIFLINLFSSPGVWWFKWALIGWGIGLAAHGLSVFIFSSVMSKEWEDRKIKELMGKDKESNPKE